MKSRAKLTIAMVLLLSLTYGIGGSLMIAQSFSSSIDRERDAAVQTYRMIVDVLDLLGDNASPGTAANTVALVLHKLGSGGSSTAARIRFGAQMTTTGDTALLDEAPEPPAGSGVTSIVHTGNGRHYLMLGATADGTTVQLAFDVTETYTVRQTQQRAYHTTFLILVAFGAAVAWVTSYLLTRPLGTLSRASRELARGNLGYRAPVRSRDEVGQLAADFNRMAGQLEQQRQPHSGDHGAAGAVHGRLLARDENAHDLHHRLCRPVAQSGAHARPSRWTRRTISSPRASGSRRWG